MMVMVAGKLSFGPVADRWGLHAGRLYVTTMNLLSLEANYRYSPLHASVLGEEKK